MKVKVMSMKKRIEIKILVLALVAIAVLPCVENASAADYVLLAKPSPADGGVVEAQAGEGGVVTLSASPSNGYRFMYWLGDVADPTAQVTTAATNAPKLVIAVYERTDFPEMVPLGGAGGGLFSTASNAPNGPGGPAPRVTTGVAPSAPGGANRLTPSFPIIEPEDQERFDDEAPVPDAEVPEPSTMALFALAGLKLIRTRKRK